MHIMLVNQTERFSSNRDIPCSLSLSSVSRSHSGEYIFNSDPFCTPRISANSSSQRSFHQTSLPGVTESWFWAKFGSTLASGFREGPYFFVRLVGMRCDLTGEE